MKTYLKWVALAFSAGLLLFCTLSYLTDPYGIYQHSSAKFARKVAAADKGRTVKPYQALLSAPATLLVGNSRVEIGLPEQHSFYQGKAAYNMGLPGAGISMQYDYAWNVIQSTKTVRQVVIALDFLDFTSSSAGNITTQVPERTNHRLHYDLNSPYKPLTKPRFRAQEQLGLLFSATTITDTLHTLLAQQHRSNALNKYGFNDGASYYFHVAAEGFGVLYQQKSAELDQRLSQPLTFNQASYHLTVLQQFIALLQSAQIDIYLLINPYQQPYLDKLTQYQLADALTLWKKQLAEVASQHQLVLYDFAISSAPVTEVVPAQSFDENASRYFWEPAHYRPALGALMLDTLQSGQCAQLCEKYSD